MNGILEKIKDTAEIIQEKISDFYEENKQLFFIVCGLILIIFICLILLIAVGSKGNKKTDEVPKQTLELTEPLLIPNGPELPRDYNISRKTKEKWTEEEANSWFTVPSDKEINSLSNANENLINDIIGAAP